MTKRHKLFISYYHKEDQRYKELFEKRFGDLFINKSVRQGEIDSDNGADYIKRLIQSDYLDDSSVLVVLVGPNTYRRKHVDWEISGALNKKVGGYSGLFGLCLPTHSDYRRATYTPALIPPRLADNLESGYAALYDWTADQKAIRKYVQEAFERRTAISHEIVNSRVQFKRNRGN